MISILCALPFLASPAPAPAAIPQDPVPVIQDLGHSWVLNFDESPPGPGGQDGGMTLEQFVKLCQENTGINFTYDKDTANLLRSTSITMFGTKEVRKEDFYSFFQILMIINKFVCTKIGPDHLAVVVVRSLDSSARNNVRADAEIIDPDELEDFADQPATLITTMVTLPNTDVRTLSNSMRAMVTDPNTMQVIPVGNSNSLIVTGFGSNVAALVRMLELVDEASAAEAPELPEFEVIPLEFAAAEEIADTISELLDYSTQVAQQGQRNQQQAAGVTGALSAGTTETKVMVYERTNALLVMAMPDDMPRIKELVARLDIDVIERERLYHFYNLENADSEELAQVLEDFLDNSQRVQGTSTAGGGRGAGATGTGTTARSSNEVVVVPDPATNSLLIAANRTRYEEVLELIQLLDKRQDQVLIETALIELSGSDFLDIGVELGGANIPGVDETGGFGLTDFDLSTISDTTGDGIPDLRVPNQLTGITAGILDGDNFSIPVLLRFVQEKRDTNVLNIPSVLVNNNGSATVSTLDEQPTTTITATGGVSSQTQENFNGYQEAGITLQISPTISASRYLRLQISLEVSNFEGSFSGAIPPPKTTRTIDTVVNVPDGDTMVIGGIIVDNASKASDRVPWFADIPLIGWLFRRDQTTKDRTSLYFFVTPHIMRDREFADLAEYSYDKKLEAADIIGAGRVRMIDDTFGGPEAGLDLSGLQLPLYQAPTRGEVDETTIGVDARGVKDMLDQEAQAPGPNPPSGNGTDQ
jgi:general secretion pathway protein D